MSQTNAFETGMLALYFQNSSFGPIGDATGLRGSTVAGNLYISLHTAFPGEAGDQTTSEAAYTGYARQAVARSAGGWTVSGNSAVNAAVITYPACIGGTETEFYFGIGSAVAGAGTLDHWGILGTNLGAFACNDTSTENITIPAHGLSVDDRVSFFPEASELGLPTGITAGTVYFVKTVTDTDRIILSTTSGGAAVNITAVGRGVAFKNIGLAVSNGITPKFASSALSVLSY